jgi:RecB family exonuclease
MTLETTIEPQAFASFLSKCAQHIAAKHTITELPHLCVVLPSRRAVLYFKKELQNTLKSLYLAPSVLSIEEFLMTHTGQATASTIELYLMLFEAVQAQDPSINFEHFISWAPTLLKDFELIDQYLVDTEQLFGYMAEAKAIERWSAQLGSTVGQTAGTDAYFELFKTLKLAYYHFNNALNKKNLNYRGRAYRQLASQLQSLLIDHPKYKKYYFMGFNALSLAEETIIFGLEKAGLAACLWQADEYFMEANVAGHMAGRFLRDYKKRTYPKPWLWTSNELLVGQKNIKIIEAPTASQQASMVQQTLQQWFADDPDTETALILADESLLQPVLLHIPTNARPFNITMGIAMRQSAVFQWVQQLFLLQIHSQKTNNQQQFNSQMALQLFSTEIVLTWLKQENKEIEPVIDYLKQAPPSLSFEDLHLRFPFIKQFFYSWQSNPTEAILYFKTFVLYLKNKNALAAEEQFFLAELDKIVENLSNLIIHKTYLNNLPGLYSVLSEHIKTSRVPFETAKDSKLQVMGMLESRCLDFKRIIVLSLNEGQLPAARRADSFIPYDALEIFGLPTHSQQDAIMSYHFFRLLQQSQQAVFCYVSSKAAFGSSKEPSRFLLQIEKNMAIQNSNISLSHLRITTPTTTLQPTLALVVQKTEDVLYNLGHWLSTKGLSATSLNSFVMCSLKFYFERLAHININEEKEDFLAPNGFGEVLHLALQKLYESIGNEEFTYVQIEKSLPHVSEMVDLAFQEINRQQSVKLKATEGQNVIFLEIAKTLIADFLTNEVQDKTSTYKNLAIEDTFVETLIYTHAQTPIKVKLLGKFDRIELKNDLLRIIDYKSGKVIEKDLKFSQQNKTTAENIDKFLLPKNDKMRQLWYYKFILERMFQNKGEIVTQSGRSIQVKGGFQTGIYSFRNLGEGFITGFDSFGEGSNFLDESENILKQLLFQMFDTSQPFARTEDEKNCEFCAYKQICDR